METKETGQTAFKKAQVRHRRRGDDPNRIDDLPDFVDFGVNNGDNRIIPLKLPPDLLNREGIYQGPIYGIKGFPGFMYAPQALDKSLQLEIAYRSVTEYCEKPHRTNIDLCEPKKNEENNDKERMWDLWKEDNKKKKQQITKKKQKVEHVTTKKYRSFKKLSWATMGHHYDWTERSYNKKVKSEMPILMQNISKMLATTAMLLDSSANKSLLFNPSASIVNYYTTKSIMGGHKDDLEIAMDKPIVSLSVGLSAVFLLGGDTKDDEPIIPILIRSGDVLCMGGNSRLAYHGMARLLPSTVPLPKVCDSCCPDPHEKLALERFENSSTIISSDVLSDIDDYLLNHRININIRQVYPDEEETCD